MLNLNSLYFNFDFFERKSFKSVNFSTFFAKTGFFVGFNDLQSQDEKFIYCPAPPHFN